MDFLSGMEFDLFAPSFPEIQQHFNLTPFWVEALLSINFIGYCGGLFIVGFLADHYGRKPIILIGLTIFILGSIICLGGNSYPLMLLGRFLQGIGVAAPSILSFLIVADLYSLKEQQSLFAILNGIMNISVGLAPVLGSYISLYFHWQGNFIALLLLSIFVFVMTIFCVPFQKQIPKREPLLQGYMAVMRSKPLMLLLTYMVISSVPYWIFVGISPLLYMKDLGVSLPHFGYYQGCLAFIFALGTFLYKFIMDKVASKQMLVLSNRIFAFSFVMIGVLAGFNINNPLLITLSIIMFVIGQIIPGTLLYPLSLNLVPEAKACAAALIQGSRLILTAIALQITGYFYQHSFPRIGFILSLFIFFTIVTLALVIRKKELMKIES